MLQLLNFEDFRRAARRRLPALLFHYIDGGADDYVVKPFRIEEVLARLRALIRRSSGQLQPELRFGPMVLDPRGARVTVGGAPVKLTGHEFRVLSYLMHHQGRVVSQAELTEHIYAQSFDRDSNTVEVFVARLRRKLETAGLDFEGGRGPAAVPDLRQEAGPEKEAVHEHRFDQPLDVLRGHVPAAVQHRPRPRRAIEGQ